MLNLVIYRAETLQEEALAGNMRALTGGAAHLARLASHNGAGPSCAPMAQATAFGAQRFSTKGDVEPEVSSGKKQDSGLVSGLLCAPVSQMRSLTAATAQLAAKRLVSTDVWLGYAVASQARGARRWQRCKVLHGRRDCNH